MHILKFGGSSLADADSILKTVQITSERLQTHAAIVVVSAFGGVTNQILDLAGRAVNKDESYKKLLKSLENRHLKLAQDLIQTKSQSEVLAKIKFLFEDLKGILLGVFLIKELSPRTSAYLMSFGERLAAFIISQVYCENGVASSFVDSRELIITNNNFQDAVVNFELSNPKIRTYFEDNLHTLHIVTGFIAKTQDGLTTTLGRGGSDYTASILAAALNAEAIEIWTDVDGVMTSDPRKVKKAITIPQLHYVEAIEMSYFGAKVLHPKTIQPILKQNIPTRIKNTFNPTHPGTLIDGDQNIKFNNQSIKAVSCIQNIALLNFSGAGIVGVSGSASRFFEALARENINIILISQASSEHSITVAVQADVAAQAAAAIDTMFAENIKNGQINPTSIKTDLVIGAVVGSQMRATPGVSGKLFKAIGNSGVNLLAIAQGSSEMNISFVVEQKDERKVMNVIHEAFFLSDTKQLNLFLVGVGQIGKTLLNQIAQEQQKLLDEQHLELRLIGAINTRQMIINSEGLMLENLPEQLAEDGKQADLETFIEQVFAYNLRNSIVLDCTASAALTDYYERIFERSISIVTPNKIACSSKMTFYNHLKNKAFKHGAHFLYETNVGAGLPILTTIKDLIKSGDKVLKIEAILSGTLNYIFNNISPEKPLSEVVREAKVKGLTEPDPRIDLSLVDVARKILILAREVGAELEIEDVEIEDFIPKTYFQLENPNDFLANLAQYDSLFNQKLSETIREGKKYAVIARFEAGKACVGLQAIGKNHPFFDVEGSDNIFLFQTKRYQTLPLIIKGAGAGAEVTASGVFADILRIA